MSEYHRVVAAILVRDDNVLLCHRRADREWFGDVWDLPGGHVNDDEDAAVALARELHEELAIEIPPPSATPLFAAEIAPDTHVTVWVVDAWSGEITNMAPEEHDQLGWFDRADLPGLDVADPAITELCLGVLDARR